MGCYIYYSKWLVLEGVLSLLTLEANCAQIHISKKKTMLDRCPLHCTILVKLNSCILIMTFRLLFSVSMSTHIQQLINLSVLKTSCCMTDSEKSHRFYHNSHTTQLCWRLIFLVLHNGPGDTRKIVPSPEGIWAPAWYMVIRSLPSP